MRWLVGPFLSADRVQRVEVAQLVTSIGRVRGVVAYSLGGRVW